MLEHYCKPGKNKTGRNKNKRLLFLGSPQVIDALSKLNEKDCIPVSTSRLLLLLDYILHDFSSPAEELLHQVCSKTESIRALACASDAFSLLDLVRFS